MRTLLPRDCEACRAPFTASPSDVRNGGGRFCSRACANGRSRTTGPRRPGAEAAPDRVERIARVLGMERAEVARRARRIGLAWLEGRARGVERERGES